MSDKESYNSLFRDAATKFYASLSPEDQEKHAKSYTDFIGMDHHAILSKIAGGNPDHTHDLATELLYGSPTGRMFKTYDPAKSTLPQRFKAIARYARLDQVRRQLKEHLKAMSLNKISEDRGPMPIAKMQELLDKKADPKPQPKIKTKKKKVKTSDPILPASAFNLSVDDKNWDDSDMATDMAAKSSKKRKYARGDEPHYFLDSPVKEWLEHHSEWNHSKTVRDLASRILAGDHSLFGRLGKTLSAIGDPESSAFNWSGVQKGLDLDSRVHHVLKANDVDPLHAGLLTNPTGSKFYNQSVRFGSGGSPIDSSLIHQQISQDLPDVSEEDVKKSLLRLTKMGADKANGGKQKETKKIIDYHLESDPTLHDFHRYQKRKFARTEDHESHPDFRQNGIAPSVGEALASLASEHHPNDSQLSALAEGILRTGDHRILPLLGDALKAESHPMAGSFDWHHLPRGIAIDKEVKHYLTRYPLVQSPLTLASGWANKQSTGVSRLKMLKTLRQSIKNLNLSDLVHSLIRLNYASRLSKRAKWEDQYHAAINQKLGTLTADPFSYPNTLRGSKRSLPFSKSVKKKEPVRFSKSDLNTFLKKIKEDPKNKTLYRVLADYLEENDLHHDQKTLDSLRAGMKLIVFRHSKTGKIKSVSADDIEALISRNPADPASRKKAIAFFDRLKKTDPKASKWSESHAFIHNLLGRHDPAEIEDAGVDLTDHLPNLSHADQFKIARHLDSEDLAPEPSRYREDPRSGIESFEFEDGSSLEKDGVHYSSSH